MDSSSSSSSTAASKGSRRSAAASSSSSSQSRESQKESDDHKALSMAPVNATLERRSPRPSNSPRQSSASAVSSESDEKVDSKDSINMPTPIPLRSSTVKLPKKSASAPRQLAAGRNVVAVFGETVDLDEESSMERELRLQRSW